MRVVAVNGVAVSSKSEAGAIIKGASGPALVLTVDTSAVGAVPAVATRATQEISLSLGQGPLGMQMTNDVSDILACGVF